ncbi:uncharacterized protein LOC112190730 [Rosa chinensis]|uniref:uncharacterized protein LOC112190730 n=1 Tax=Rosa chinensis TaxID=74649 RepID=UPI000D08AD40|nr:uncharacterized protein LOC112190730 [Rosa chinensis]
MTTLSMTTPGYALPVSFFLLLLLLVFFFLYFLLTQESYMYYRVQSPKDGRRFSQILTFQGFRAHLMFLGSFRLVIKSKGGETWDAQESDEGDDGGRLLELQQLQR